MLKTQSVVFRTSRFVSTICCDLSPYSRSLFRRTGRCSECNQGVYCTIRSMVSKSGDRTDFAKNNDKAANQNSNSYMMNLFRGKLNVSEIIPFPKALNNQQLSDLKDLVDPLEKFIQTEVDPFLLDEKSEFPPSVLASLRELGAYGIQVPEQYGGLQLCNTAYARLVKIVGMRDLSLGIHLGAHQSIGYKGLLLYGSPEQKSKYLPGLASGELVAAYCLTEPGSGSDVSSIQSKAELSADGRHYVLNGTKIWISNGGLADFFTVFAKTPVTDERGDTKPKLTAFLVERAFGGVTNGPPDKKMGINASNTVSMYFENCHVPVENVLGQVGDGFKVAVNILNQGRFGMAAALAGTMHVAIQKAAEHAVQRKQFGQTLDQFEVTQEKLAFMAMRQYVSESMAYMIAGSMDLGAKDFQVEAAISKIYSSESAWYCLDEAIQIFGGAGFMKSTGLERVLRDLRVFRIFEGANDVLRLFVALTGLNYAGKHLTSRSKTPIGLLSIATNSLKRSIGLGGEGRQLANHLPPVLKEPGNMAGEAIDELSGAAESLLKRYRKAVINEQFRLMRLADAAIQVYGMTCVLSRAAQAVTQGSTTADHEVRMAKLACYEGNKAVHRYLSELGSSEDSKHFAILKSLSSEICNNTGVLPLSPIGI